MLLSDFGTVFYEDQNRLPLTNNSYKSNCDRMLNPSTYKAPDRMRSASFKNPK